MKKLLMALAVLGFASPAFADEQRASAQATTLDDSALDQVAAGCETQHGTGTSVAPVTNVNISPIIVNQTAVAFNQQKAVNKGKGKGNNKIKQNATAVAMNVANINYTVKF